MSSAATSSLCDQPVLDRYWYPVARAIDIQRSPIAIRLLGRDHVVWRNAGGEFTAAPDRCPHREAPLSAGDVIDGCLQCPYHGWTYDGGGRCVRIPSAAPGTPVPPTARLDVHHVQERYGLVWLCTGDPVGDIPKIVEDDDPAYRRVNTPVDVWHASAGRMVDNFLDISHFPFVHTGTFGRAQDTLVSPVELGPIDDWFGYRYEVDATNEAVGTMVTGQDTAVVHRRMTTGFILPFFVRSTIHYHTGLNHILLLLSTPIDDESSYFTFVVWRNDDFAVSAEEIVRFDLAIGAEDKRMLERLRGPLPLDQTGLVSVQADKCSVEWRRRLRALLAS
jgi:phenylpropionate dioxygenase-like ring-hydroxylating dioxygenase large terminal subunit